MSGVLEKMAGGGCGKFSGLLVSILLGLSFIWRNACKQRRHSLRSWGLQLSSVGCSWRSHLNSLLSPDLCVCFNETRSAHILQLFFHTNHIWHVYNQVRFFSFHCGLRSSYMKIIDIWWIVLGNVFCVFTSWRCFVLVFSKGHTHSMPWTTKTCSICGTGPNTIWPLKMGKCSSALILNSAYLRSGRCGRKQASREKWKRMTFAAMESEQAVSRRGFFARFVSSQY